MDAVRRWIRRAAAAWVAYNILQVYLRLRKRQRMLDAAKGRSSPPPNTEKKASRESYTALVDQMRASATQPDVGFLADDPHEARLQVAESCAFVSGGAAALLQSAHPYIAEGVTASATFKTNVRDRFHKTFLYVFRICTHF